jgi:glycosyltransferase involved in cell wall biosynthesis
LIDQLGPERVFWLRDEEHLRDWRLPLLYPAVRHLFRRLQPDLAILSLPQSNFLGRLAASCAPSAVIASFEHGQSYRRATGVFLMRCTARLVDRVLYDHPATWRAMRSVYTHLAPDQGLYVPLTTLEPRPRSTQAWPLRRLLSIGRLAPQKNQAELIEALALLRSRGHLLELNLVGDGPDRGRLEQLTRRCKLQGQVRFHGFQANIRPHLEAADFYVQPSLWEGLCRTVLEAMAEGLLVISTDVGGMSDYGVDGDNMIKATSPDRERLAEALQRALQLPEREIASMGRRAAATVAEQFSSRVVEVEWRRALQVLSAEAAERQVQGSANSKASLRFASPGSAPGP